jgi:hypothetical protein
MKTQAKDAVALAMDWLAQLREEDSAGPPPGDGQPATDSAPLAADFTEAAPIEPPAGDFTEAAPALLPAADYGDAGPAATPVDDSWPAARHASDFWDADPSAPAAGDFRDTAAGAPPAANFGDAAPAAPPAADFWWTAAPSASDSGPVVAPGTRSSGRAGTKADVEITSRAVIGDELRVPLAWCEMGACISHYADPAALGEADIRARAIETGWRADALGRLACPQCQQGDSWFWTAHPAVLWDRDTAVAMTTLMAAAMREIASADGPAGMEPGAFPGGEPDVVPGPRPEVARPPGRGRHREHPAHADRAR